MANPDTSLPLTSTATGALTASTAALVSPTILPPGSTPQPVGIAAALGAGTGPGVSLSSPMAPLPTARALFDDDVAATSVVRDAGAIPVTAASLQHIRIKEHVLTALDLKRNNYGRWSTLFMKVIGRNGLEDHLVAGADHKLEDAEWMKVDLTIVSWLYTTISEEILDIILAPHDPAFVVWTKLSSLFLDNMMTQAVYMEEEFRSLQQGHLSVTDYCSRLKVLADGLRDVGIQVSDQSMLFNMLRGLNPSLGHAISVLTMQQPLPSFMRAHSYLLLEEHRQEQAVRRQAAAAFFVDRFGAPAPASPQGSPSSSNKKNKKRETASTSPAAGGSRFPNSPAAPSWPHGVNPWSGTFQAWQQTPRAPGAGVLGPRPPMAPTAREAYNANTSMMAPSFSSATPVAPALDPNFMVAMQQMSLQNNGGGDWFLDTGASSHMTSSTGSAFQGGDSAK
ncbi:uncharacterized protein LOC104583223 [Brachypodium distachyon]|uniref:uncharacterized protein LOC104583223 n=1 Tax=Brachypodium distachyon TaxID=15368 RepID=UPI00052FECAF|nr:uncharacterized protein LOC104583223 [Brachypodium distachyon]|eukprot:XP_010233327.1 uncharacterized protein LOC104583223 [Brachypodium distachyon]